MKTLNYFFGALCAMALATSCEKENTFQQEIPTPEPKPATEYVGSMTVDQMDGTSFTKEGVKVSYELLDDTTMEIVMYGAKFAEAMPLELDMTISGVEYSKSDNGYTLSGDNIIPYAMGGPFEQYTITGLIGNINDEGMELDFTCGVFPVSFSGTTE